ncbi:MAG: hypothetical protein J07HX5_00590 [halophilic archaeon J07HX5]|nr:MAG: hypothetical protein J07HX5_00590 [halophilic archaeon J07HX5]
MKYNHVRRFLALVNKWCPRCYRHELPSLTAWNSGSLIKSVLGRAVGLRQRDLLQTVTPATQRAVEV